jgi:hypothetical protein
MLLSKPQVTTFWRLWAKACKAQGWDQLPKDQVEAKRHALLRECGFASLTEVDRVAGFTQVKHRVEVLIGTSVQAGLEISDETLNQARVMRHVIRTELMPCLALYEQDPERYLQTIITGLVRWRQVDQPTRPPTLEDLDAKPTFSRQGPCHTLRTGPSQLSQALMTLNARIHSKRREAGDTIHDMRIRAGVRCTCKRCTDARARELDALTTFPAPELPVPPHITPAASPEIQTETEDDPF